jgi:hypothetical protein
MQLLGSAQFAGFLAEHFSGTEVVVIALAMGPIYG